MYSKKDLEKRTMLFYGALQHDQSLTNFIDLFEKYYEIGYVLVFKDFPIREAFETLLLKYYRNEHCIKYQFVKGKLNRSDSISYAELPVNNSRTDLFTVYKNKTFTFEIKTKYDTTKRLEKQLSDYSMFFDFIYVICDGGKLSSVENKIPSYCGIYTYESNSKKLIFKKMREAKKNKNIDESSILSEMWLSEKHFYFKTIDEEKIKVNFSQEKICSSFKKALATRYDSRWNKLKLVIA